MPVSLSLLAGAGWQFFDNSGTPLSGGKLYSYVAGTTTPATTYTDATGVQANTNPIILNSAGRVPYEIWLTSGTNYKFILKTSTDTLLGTYDNIRSAATSLDGTGTNNAVTYFNATGAFSSSPNFTFNDSTNALTVAGNISGNNISAGGTLAVTGNSTLSGTLNVTGNTTVTGTIASTGGITSSTPAVTQAAGDNSTKIATTAFVQAAGQITKIQPITAVSSGSGGITIGLAPTTLQFVTSTANVIATYSNTSSISITLPSGANLGVASGQSARLLVLALAYSSSIRLGVANIACVPALDETSAALTSTTATTSNQVFSENVAGGVPNGTYCNYRVIGFIDATYSGGSWASPSLVQGQGGMALNALSSIGYGQYWTLGYGVASGTTYYNTNKKPIMLTWTGYSSVGFQSIDAYVNNVAIYQMGTNPGTALTGSIIIPANASYKFIWTLGGGLQFSYLGV